MIRRLTIAAALMLLVGAVYAQVRGFGFVAFDDNRYVYENDHVRQGLTAQGARWALTSFDASNWHPITWMSHMADVSMFGLRPGPHHVVSALLHALSAVLLFLLLESTTGQAWRSAFVAAAFAAHPAHVESVAWIAERKDVLGGLFWMLTMLAYARYVRHPGAGRYAIVVVAYALGLASKPMLVTLPFVLLLFDVWPLGRLSEPMRSWKLAAPLVREKLPLFALAAGSCVLTVMAQSAGGALSAFEALPMGTRFAHAAVSYVRYLGMLAWPRALAVFYPHPGVGSKGVPVGAVAAALLVLAVFTWAAARAGKRHPAVPFGWLWYLGTLVPVIGIVQVGLQGIADRYTYIPSVGIFIAIAWAIPEVAVASRARRAAVATLATACLTASAVAAWAQAAVWRDSETLFRHATEARPDSWLAWKNLGVELFHRGAIEEAQEAFRRSLAERTDDADTWVNLALCYGATERHAEAADALQNALKLRPDDAEAWFNLGVARALLGQLGAADHAVSSLDRLDRRRADELRQRIAELTPRR